MADADLDPEAERARVRAFLDSSDEEGGDDEDTSAPALMSRDETPSPVDASHSPSAAQPAVEAAEPAGDSDPPRKGISFAPPPDGVPQDGHAPGGDPRKSMMIMLQRKRVPAPEGGEASAAGGLIEDPEAEEALKECRKLERQIEMQLSTRRDAGRILKLRITLRKQYEQLMVTHPVFSTTRDVDVRLWRSVFYIQIEEFRRQRKSALQQGNQSAAQAMQAQFSSFVEESCGSYESMLETLLSRRDAHAITHPSPESPDSTEAQRVGKSLTVDAALQRLCSRCYVYLGDLARYKEIHTAAGGERDWSAALRHYTQALEVCPHSGNPHNQLAVLAHYAQDELGTVYCYLRAIAAVEPFQAAKDNLAAVFDKAVDNMPPGPLATSRTDPSQRAWHVETIPIAGADKKTIAKAFVNRLVLCLGILYTERRLEDFQGVLDSAIGLYKALLEKGWVGEEMGLKVLLMCAFSLYS
eukprot:Hpha_TRINITY_DN28328_c0_g1::TRINITY_DN28328_c0_g1_i1::g.2297::m.2297/K14409/SMG7, EST1C; protein SMG7